LKGILSSKTFGEIFASAVSVFTLAGAFLRPNQEKELSELEKLRTSQNTRFITQSIILTPKYL